MKMGGWWRRDALALCLLWAGCAPLGRGAASTQDEASVGLDGSGRALAHEAGGGALDASAALSLESGVMGHAELADDAGASAATLPWLRSEVALEPDGRSVPLSFALSAFQRPVFALRAYAADAAVSAGLCFQLEEVRADTLEWWVPRATSADYGDYCTRCAQRVAVGRGYGMFVLPSATDQPDRITTLELRIALRDCLTLSPLSLDTKRPDSLVVESESFAAPARDTKLLLPLSIVVATPYAFGDGAELGSVFAKLREIWRAAGIELLLRGPLSLPRPVAPVVYGATDRQALSALALAAKALAREAGVEPAAPWLVLTPCLIRQDPSAGGQTQPLAVTTHLPGGFSVTDEADGIFVAVERCGGLTPAARYLESDSLAAVIAHELGHYLGLFHVQEPDGREDSLPDTHVDEPSLMQAMPSAEATGLAESQISIARRHPALAVTTRDKPLSGKD